MKLFLPLQFSLKQNIQYLSNLIWFFQAQNLSNLKENHLSSMHPTKSQCYSPVENIKILALKIARFVVFERTTLVLKCSSLQQLPKKQVILHVVLSTYKLFGRNTNKKQKQYFKTISFVRVSSFSSDKFFSLENGENADITVALTKQAQIFIFITSWVLLKGLYEEFHPVLSCFALHSMGLLTKIILEDTCC